MPILPPQPLKMRNVFLSAACLLLTWPAVARASSTGRGVSPRAQQAGARAAAYSEAEQAQEVRAKVRGALPVVSYRE